MMDLHHWTTPNGHEVAMFLEEAGLPYRIIPVDISAGDQFKPEFLAIAPNNRLPAMVDHEPRGGGAPVSLFESGAILLCLADKTGRFVAPAGDVRGRAEALQWLFWQMGGLGPVTGRPFVADEEYDKAEEINTRPVVSGGSKRVLFGQTAADLASR